MTKAPITNPPKPPMQKSKLAGIIGASAATALLASTALWEGKSNDPYKDIVGIWTVCYGETKVQMRPYTDAECKQMLDESLAGYAQQVLEINPELRGHDNQTVAATMLAYNIGIGAYRRSSVSRYFRAGQWRKACDSFLLWNRAGGKEVRGLTNRRRFERNICLKDLPR